MSWQSSKPQCKTCGSAEAMVCSMIGRTNHDTARQRLLQPHIQTCSIFALAGLLTVRHAARCPDGQAGKRCAHREGGYEGGSGGISGDEALRLGQVPCTSPSQEINDLSAHKVAAPRAEARHGANYETARISTHIQKARKLPKTVTTVRKRTELLRANPYSAR